MIKMYLSLIIRIVFLFRLTTGVIEDNFQIEEKSLIVSCGPTWISKKGADLSLPMVRFINSSSGIGSLLMTVNESSVCTVDIWSILWIRDCITWITNRNATSLFVCEGRINAERLSFLSSYSMRTIFDCTDTPKIISAGCFSSIEVKLSSFKDIKVSSYRGGFISGVNIGREGVISCSFENVSVGEGEDKGEWRRLRRAECFMSDSLITRGENGIYGVIVSGVDERIGGGYSFVSNNNTFVECYRTQQLHPTVEVNSDYTNKNYTSRITLSNSSSHTITNCTFTGCGSSSNSGGAIRFSIRTEFAHMLCSQVFTAMRRTSDSHTASELAISSAKWAAA